ncbi:MAG: VOC family protein [Euzebyales bacterium]|nr:VOC family protein [Euzebyales bacterium]
MVVRLAQWTLDVRDVELMAAFWSKALGYRVEVGGDGCAKLYPPGDTAPEVPTLWLQATSDEKRGKNRDHPDMRPQDGDVDSEVGRLVALGAQHVDVGQTGKESFVVLADPEGNEFCVLRREPRQVSLLATRDEESPGQPNLG